MKTLILVTASLLAYETASVQTLTNDPGFHSHNYKHVNKAKTVVRKDTSKGNITLGEINRDYKKPLAKSKENVLQIVTPSEAKGYLKVKNYKMPNG